MTVEGSRWQVPTAAPGAVRSLDLPKKVTPHGDIADDTYRR
ncbi:hypothetical protein ACX9NI_05645 [Mycobacterium sp. ML5]